MRPGMYSDDQISRLQQIAGQRLLQGARNSTHGLSKLIKSGLRTDETWYEQESGHHLK